MAQQIVMPQLGESVVEGKIVEWLVGPGDRVEAGTPLLEVETDKANTEVPATGDGYVRTLLAEVGDTVDVGTPLIELSDSPPDAPGVPTAPETTQRSDPRGASRTPTTAPAPTPVAPPRRPVTTPPATAIYNAQDGGDGRPWNAGGVVAAPTRQMVSLPLAQRSPTGHALAAKATAAATAPAAPAADTRPAVHGPYGSPAGGRFFRPPTVRANPEDTVIPFSKRRGIIAEHMVYSKHVSPHVPCFAEIDVTDVMAERKRHKAQLAEQGISLSLLAFVSKAICEALREFPALNAVVGADEVIQRGRVHLGVAVETEGGLLVPVIRDADGLSVGGLARAVGELATKAREKRIMVDDLSGGTFTVSNPGRRGNLFGAAIINQPQVGILRMGEVVRRPVVREVDGSEAICIRSMMFLSLSYDHRIIDGVTGNGFLYRVRELLESGGFQI